MSIDFTGSATIAGIDGQGVIAGAVRPGGLIRSNSVQNGRGVPYPNYAMTFADQLSWIRQSHTVKFGVELRQVRIYTDRLGGAQPATASRSRNLTSATRRISGRSDPI